MRFCILVSALCLLTSVAFPRPEPGFDPRAVVRQVRDQRAAGLERGGTIPGFRFAFGHTPRPRGPDPVPAMGFDDGEFLIDTSVTYVPATDAQDPAVAFDGTNFLVVWMDARVGQFFDICGARISRAGLLFDPGGIMISTVSGNQGWPAVTFDGTNFLVVWNGGPYDICGSRVSPGGVVIDPDGIAISTAAGDQAAPAVALDGTNALVVWQDSRNGSYDIYGARVGPSGAVLDPDGVAISTAANDQFAPAVSFDGANDPLVWQDFSGGLSDIYAARVSPSGAVLDSSGIAVSTAPNNPGNPAVSFEGTDYLVIWADNRSGPYDIYGARVSPGGTVLDPDGIPISTAANDQVSPRLAFDGANSLVVWEDFRNESYDIYGARVNPSGAVLDPDGIAISTATLYQDHPAVSFDGANFLVVWDDSREHYNLDIYGARVSQSGSILDPEGVAVSTVANEQWRPAVSSDGTNYLVVWVESRSDTTSAICGARVSQTGTVLDPGGIAVANAWSVPAISFDGTNYLVVWTDERSGNSDVYGARVSPGGVVLDPDGVAVSTANNAQSAPVVAFDGTNFLVVWMDLRSGSSEDIYGARVTPNGTLLDPNGIAVSTADNNQGFPAVGFGGTDFLVTWTDEGRSGRVYGARVSRDGTVLDPEGIAISTGRSAQWTPVGSDGVNFLVLWEDCSDIYGARVSPGGVVLDSAGIAISTSPSEQHDPAVLFDGANYLVVWDNSSSNSYRDICCAWMSPNGTVFDSGLVVRQEGNQQCPALARGTGSQAFLVYQGWAGTVDGRVYNASRVWGKLGPFPGIEESRRPTANSSQPAATIVRGVLVLQEHSTQNTGCRAREIESSAS
ncbi:MAG: hypothetical protein NTX53_07020 [candidate division WOR-3 bacterium]|nr:hypothetical protein [candidate division WOR-3 bacterium]